MFEKSKRYQILFEFEFEFYVLFSKKGMCSIDGFIKHYYGLCIKIIRTKKDIFSRRKTEGIKL